MTPDTTTDDTDEQNQYTDYHVAYEQQSGTHLFGGDMVLRVPDTMTLADALHAYFSEYYGPDTELETSVLNSEPPKTVGRTYHDGEMGRYLEIEGVTELPEADAEVMRRRIHTACADEYTAEGSVAEA